MKNTLQQLNLLMLATEYPPAKGFGLARYACEMAGALAKLGHTVHVLNCNHVAKQPQQQTTAVHVHCLSEQTPLQHYEWIGNTVLNNALLLDEAMYLSDKFGPFDAIISHDWLASHTAKSLRSILDIPWMLIMHDTESGKRQGKLTPHQQYIAEMEAWSLSHADIIATTCDFMADELTRLYGVPESRIVLTPCGVTPDSFESETDLRDFRALFAREQEKLVLYAGRLSPMKGVRDLLDAFFILCGEIDSMRLVIAGDGLLKEPLQERARDMGIADKVLFTGTLSEKPLGAFYKCADCVVVPSHYEPFGMVALEAAASGARVVASDVGGLREIIELGEGQVIDCPPKEPNVLAQRIGLALKQDRPTCCVLTGQFTWRKAAQLVSQAIQAKQYEIQPSLVN